MKALGGNVLLCARREKASHDLERFEELLRFVEDALHTEQNRVESWATQKINDLNDKIDASLLAEFYAEDIFQVEIDFPRLQRYALFVSLMSMVESNLIGFCRTAHRIFSISKVFDSTRPQVIKRCMEYLEQGSEIDMSQFKYYIDLSINLNHIRNCIVHAEGSLKNRKDSEIIKNFIKDKPTISLDMDKHERILFNKGFVECYSEEMHNFFDCLSVELAKKFSTHQII